MKRSIACSLSAALLLVACGRPPFPKASPAGERPLLVLLGAEPRTLDPHLPFDDLSSVVLDNLFQSLVRFDRSLRISSGLAVRWINPDDRTWRFFLDKQARFPDATPVTASDVKFSLERVGSLAGSEIMGFARHIASTRVVDDHTIDIRTDTPIAILNSLAFIPIVSERRVAAAPDHVGDEPFGSGAYRLVRWDKGRSLVLEANEHYRPQPAIRRVEFLIAKEDKALLETLATRKPELAALLRWSLHGELKKRKPEGYRLVSAPGLGVYYLQLNTRRQIPGRPGKNPLHDKAVRRALALASDGAELVHEGIHGAGRPAGQLVVPQVFGFDPSIIGTRRDPAAARALLRQAGHPALEVPLLVQEGGNQKLEELLIRQWAEAGIRGTLEAVLVDKLDAALARGAFSASIQGFACTSADVSEILTSALHTPQPGRGDGAFNYGAFSNSEIDAIADENLKVFDPRRRLEMLQKSLRVAAEEMPLLPLFVSDDPYLISRELRWEPWINGVVDVSEMSFAADAGSVPR